MNVHFLYIYFLYFTVTFKRIILESIPLFLSIFYHLLRTQGFRMSASQHDLGICGATRNKPTREAYEGCQHLPASASHPSSSRRRQRHILTVIVHLISFCIIKFWTIFVDNVILLPNWTPESSTGQVKMFWLAKKVCYNLIKNVMIWTQTGNKYLPNLKYTRCIIQLALMQLWCFHPLERCQGSGVTAGVGW